MGLLFCAPRVADGFQTTLGDMDTLTGPQERRTAMLERYVDVGREAAVDASQLLDTLAQLTVARRPTSS